MQLGFDLLKYFVGRLLKWGVLLSDNLFSVLGIFTLILLTIKFIGVKNINRRIFFTISIPVILITLIISFTIDIQTIVNSVNSVNKYIPFAMEEFLLAENANYLFGIRNFVLDLISSVAIIVALYFSTTMVKVEDKEEFHTKEAHFVTRIASILLLSFVICGAKVLILPQNSLRLIHINRFRIDTIREAFTCDCTLIQLSRSISYGEEKIVYNKEKRELCYRGERVLTFWMDGEYSGQVLDEIKIHGTEVVIVCDDEAIAYLREGEPYAVTFEEIGNEGYDEILLGTCEKLLEEGRLECFEYISKYIMKYDPEFAKPYIERYCAGEFTDSELQQIGSIRPEYITKCAQQVTAG